jgi:RNA-directed DNA polymerase
MGKPADPLRRRRYLHFDEPMPRSALEKLVTNPAEVARWEFFPLIRSAVVGSKVRNKNKQTGQIDVKEKIRPICYASHRDSALYGVYASHLAYRYEDWLAANGLSESITAFRPGCGKCNIHYACESFYWIEANRPCVALAFDISSFFDSLDHKLLKAKWCELIGSPNLPAGQYAVYKSLIRAHVVDREILYKKFKISRHNPRANGRTKICSSADFRTAVVGGGLLEAPKPVGIPQGTSISAVLSNIYLMDFDRAVAQMVSTWGGLYRRYCDDILVVVPPQWEAAAKAAIDSEMSSAKMTVQPEKTEAINFYKSVASSRPLQYLGLLFDGNRILLRPGGIGRYYGRLRAGVRNAGKSRRANEDKMGLAKNSIDIRRKSINQLYSHLGRRNFISYAHRAAELSGHAEIRRQVSRHWRVLEEAVRSEDNR